MDYHPYNFDYQQWSASAYQDPSYSGYFPYAYPSVHAPAFSPQEDVKKSTSLPDTTDEPNPDDFRELSALVHGMPSVHQALLCGGGGDPTKLSDFGGVEASVAAAGVNVNHQTLMAHHQQQLAAHHMYFGQLPMGLANGFMQQQMGMNKLEEIVVKPEIKEENRTVPTHPPLPIEVPRYPSRKHNNSHKCTYCPKRYITISELQGHMLECQKARAHACQVCGKRFTKRSGLMQHMKTHRGERPYECHFCDQRFHQKSHLDQHERIHTGAKPFQCSICGQAFRQRAQQLGHEARHNNKGEYADNRVQVGVIAQPLAHHNLSDPKEQSLLEKYLSPTRKPVY